MDDSTNGLHENGDVISHQEDEVNGNDTNILEIEENKEEECKIGSDLEKPDSPAEPECIVVEPVCTRVLDVAEALERPISVEEVYAEAYQSDLKDEACAVLDVAEALEMPRAILVKELYAEACQSDLKDEEYKQPDNPNTVRSISPIRDLEKPDGPAEEQVRAKVLDVAEALERQRPIFVEELYGEAYQSDLIDEECFGSSILEVTAIMEKLRRFEDEAYAGAYQSDLIDEGRSVIHGELKLTPEPKEPTITECEMDGENRTLRLESVGETKFSAELEGDDLGNCLDMEDGYRTMRADYDVEDKKQSQASARVQNATVSGGSSY